MKKKAVKAISMEKADAMAATSTKEDVAEADIATNTIMKENTP